MMLLFLALFVGLGVFRATTTQPCTTVDTLLRMHLIDKAWYYASFVAEMLPRVRK